MACQYSLEDSSILPNYRMKQINEQPVYLQLFLCLLCYVIEKIILQ